MGLSVASRIPFHDLCNLCEKLSLASREKRLTMFSKYVAFFRNFGDKLKEEVPEIDTSFYPVLRLLLPQLDRDRGAYGVKEHTLANILIRILCLAKDGQDAAKLLNFRVPGTVGAQAGDFAEVAFFVLKKRCSEGRTLTVDQVNAHLDNLAFKHAAHDPRGMDDELIAILKEMSAHESKWLTRMLLKDVKLGIGQTTILNTFHPDANSLFDVCNNLHKVCVTLHDPSRRLHEVEVSLFSPFRPMLAQQCNVRFVDTCFTSSPATSFYYAETKHDGERFQLHYGDGAFRYFSKKGYEYTSVYGCDSSSGILTPALANCLRPGLTNCILDGEMMVWDSRLETFRSKGDNIDVKTLKNGGTLKPCFCVFDVLMLDGVVLTDKPLSARVALLDDIFVSAEGVLLNTRRKTVTTKAEVLDELNGAIDDKLEGIMIKDPTSVYRPNARKAGWFKIKPEYTDGLSDQLDALIVGGYYGEGRHKGHVSHFLLAAAVTPSETGTPTEFHSLSKVGSGYSMLKLEELLRKLQPHWTTQRPAGVICTKEKADVWLEPRNSFLLQVKASELTQSSAFATSVTLRFPRVEDIRYDKEWHECVTTAQLEDLATMAAGKLCSRHVTADDVPAEEPKRRRTTTTSLGTQFRAADVALLPRESEVLAGKELCVLTGFGDKTKQQVEEDVYRRGGRFVQNPGPATWCLLASDVGSIRVGNAVRSGRWDVVRTSWLYAAPAEWSPRDLLGATSQTRALMASLYDRFGDSFTQPVSDLQLLELTAGVAVDAAVADPDMADMDVEVFGGPSPYAIFRLCRAHFVDCLQDTELRVLALDFGLYGGVTSPAVEDSTTHVVVHSRRPEALSHWRDVNLRRIRKFHLVSEEWVRCSVAHKRRLLESRF